MKTREVRPRDAPRPRSGAGKVPLHSSSCPGGTGRPSPAGTSRSAVHTQAWCSSGRPGPTRQEWTGEPSRSTCWRGVCPVPTSPGAEGPGTSTSEPQVGPRSPCSRQCASTCPARQEALWGSAPTWAEAGLQLQNRGDGVLRTTPGAPAPGPPGREGERNEARPVPSGDSLRRKGEDSPGWVLPWPEPCLRGRGCRVGPLRAHTRTNQ